MRIIGDELLEEALRANPRIACFTTTANLTPMTGDELQIYGLCRTYEHEREYDDNTSTRKQEP